MNRTQYLSLPDSVIAQLSPGIGVDDQIALAQAREEGVAKHPHLKPHQGAFVGAVLHEAHNRGRLVKQHKRLTRCDVCGARSTYQKYRSGRRKGQDNYDRPITLAGWELARRSVTVQGSASVGCCSDCFASVEASLRVALSSVCAEMPATLTGYEPAWIWHGNRTCLDCGWEGHSGEMGLRHAAMGGKYPAECPECDAVNLPFGRTRIEVAPGFAVVPAE
jgi:hypothetical protein